MNKIWVSRLLVVLLFAAPVTALLVPGGDRLASERRLKAVFPELPGVVRAGTVKEYFRGIDAFFADRFPLRSLLLGFSTALHEVGGDSLNMDKCIVGAEGWLFLGNSYARCVDKLQGRVRLTEAMVEKQARQYIAHRDAAEQAGARFYLLAAPDKTAIYPEYLPPVIVPAAQRFMDPLLDRLREGGVAVLDPRERLVQARPEGFLYLKKDTHWNARGAHVAFAMFLEQAGLPSLPPFVFTDTRQLGGDLADIGGYAELPSDPGEYLNVQWQTAPQRREVDGAVLNAAAPADKVLWVFGDSFFWALKPYAEAAFSEVRHFGHDQFAEAMRSGLRRPDVVLWVAVERNLARFP